MICIPIPESLADASGREAPSFSIFKVPHSSPATRLPEKRLPEKTTEDDVLGLPMLDRIVHCFLRNVIQMSRHGGIVNQHLFFHLK